MPSKRSRRLESLKGCFETAKCLFVRLIYQVSTCTVGLSHDWSQFTSTNTSASRNRVPTLHNEGHGYKFADARLMFVCMDFDRFRVAVPTRVAAHCFGAAFFMDAVDREVRGEKTRTAFFFPFELAPRSKGQRAIEPEIGDEPGNRLAIRRHLLCDREILELIARHGGPRTQLHRSLSQRRLRRHQDERACEEK